MPAAALFVPRISVTAHRNATDFEAPLHPFRQLTATATFACALTTTAALAAETWFDQLFGPAAPPRTEQRAPVPAARPSRWHTIVVPVPQPAAHPVDPPRSIGTLARRAPQDAPVKPLTGYAHELAGLASFYSENQDTSSGEPFDKRALTAAHKTLPLGTRVRVTNLANGRSTIVRINDRGPFTPGRVIDLSEAAAEQIAMTGPGIARVSLDVVK